MNFKSLDVIKVPVKNQEKAKEFYVEKFSFEVRLDVTIGPEERWIELIPLKGAKTCIAPVEVDGDVKPGSALGLVLMSSNVAEDRLELMERGVEVSEIDDTPYCLFIYFKDLDGNPWTAVQPK